MPSAPRSTWRERVARAEQSIAKLDATRELAASVIETTREVQSALADLRSEATDAQIKALALLWLYKRDMGRSPTPEDYRAAVEVVRPQV